MWISAAGRQGSGYCAVPRSTREEVFCPLVMAGSVWRDPCQGMGVRRRLSASTRLIHPRARY
ncbi:hypothetical protein E2C01_034500 [Portunus trituberculatus]|uniref:Uncharacterized protein n=1 Tax=Portunus trituberculatus TaxID=210409 RepID=A0A5B7F5U0_PORTR|nr:hypothetical protein [Portunus trituberculatus]